MTAQSNTIREAVEKGKRSDLYQNYLSIRDRVLEMIQEDHGENTSASDYWREELAGFEYIFDASPLILERLREHCYHLTGIRPFDYRKHHESQKELYEKKLQLLREQDEDNLWIPESKLLGGFGFEIEGGLANLDTLKFYECLIALNKAGILAPLRSAQGQKKTIIEIGAGWGGFAYQLKTLCPQITYIIVDLPPTLLFSGIYLKTLFPEARFLIYGDKPKDILLKDYQSYDFILLPHYYWEDIQLNEPELAVNMASFQEMTSAQVENYACKMAQLKVKYVYSMNRERSPYNNELSSVSAILKEYYSVQELKILDSTYVDLPVSLVKGKGAHLVESMKVLARRWLQPNQFKYRHLIGKIKTHQLR